MTKSGNPFMPAQFTCRFIHRAVKRVSINCCRRSIQPNPRRIAHSRDHAIQQPCRSNARVVNLTPILRRVPAVHAAPGQVDADIRALQRLNPRPNLFAIPMHRLPGRRVGSARQHRHMVAALLEMPRQHLSHLSAAAGQHNAQPARTRYPRLTHAFSLSLRALSNGVLPASVVMSCKLHRVWSA